MMTVEKSRLVFGIAGALILLLAVYLVVRENAGTSPSPDDSAIGVKGGTTERIDAINGTKSADAKNKVEKDGDAAAMLPTVSPESKKEIDKLQDYLDSEETQQEALAQAVKMAREGDADQILAALDAFRWLGGRESKVALLELIRHGGDLGARAMETVQTIFQADAIDDERDFDADVCIDVIRALVDESEREAFMVLLTSNPVEVAAPALIKLWGETDDKELLNLVREHFESIAEGLEIPDKAAAEKWLEEYKVNKEKEEKEAAEEE